ncbi:MAG TPA: CRTAC1 family protein [Gemmataceae bacterium]
MPRCRPLPLLLLPALLTAACNRPPQTSPAEPALAPTPGLPWFEDVTAEAGIDFEHFDSATEMHYIQETLGSGLGWIDYDNDGWVDLFCVQDGPVRPKPGDPAPTNKLYRNNRDGTFTDVTEKAGLARSGFGLGCAVGDYDNDGFDDLAVTYHGGVVLYRNQGDGTFADVTEKAGLHDPHLATSCGWGDIDGDGLLDLYVCNYVEIDMDHYPDCRVREDLRRTCSPSVFPAVAHKLFRNRGDGTFADVSESAGIAAARPAPGLGVLLIDLDDDGRLDIYAANDLQPSYLFHNRGDGRFTDEGTFSGAGLETTGAVMAGMGVDAADVDGSGRPSLFVTNFQWRPNVLFRNQGRLRFSDVSRPSGLGPPSLDRLGFGTVFFDADGDGNADVAVANGHVYRNAEVLDASPYAQRPQLFLGDGAGKFRDVSEAAGAHFRRSLVGRGLARADFDNDGKPDLAFSHCGGPAVLLRNATATGNRWLSLELEGDGKRSNRNAIGARVEVEAGGRKQVHFVTGGGSYLSQSERRLLIGLGTAARAERVTVRWPSGRVQAFGPLEPGRAYRLREGADAPAPR